MKTKFSFFLVLSLLLSFFPYSQAFAQSGQAVVGFSPSAATIATGSNAEIAVSIQNVQGLYAFDVTVKYDPSMLVILDADASTAGVQISQGNFMEGGMSVINTVDSNAGVIRYAATELNPSPAKDGTGILMVIRLRGLKEGQTQLSLANVQLSSRQGTAIQFSTSGADITISSTPPAGPTPTPFAVITPVVTVQANPAANATSEPATPAPGETAQVQPGSPTEAAAAAATQAPAGKPTLAPTYTPTPGEASGASVTPVSSTQPSGSWLDVLTTPLCIGSTILELIVVIFLVVLVLRKKDKRRK